MSHRLFIVSKKNGNTSFLTLSYRKNQHFRLFIKINFCNFVVTKENAPHVVFVKKNMWKEN